MKVTPTAFDMLIHSVQRVLAMNQLIADHRQFSSEQALALC